MKTKNIVSIFILIFLKVIFSQAQHPQNTYKKVENMNVLIPDFQVNDNIEINGVYQDSPSISVDNSGNFVVTWVDRRDGNSDIYAQRFSIDGNPIGINFKGNDDQGITFQGSPAVAADSGGNFMLVWQDYRERDNADIYAQCYFNDGSKLGTNFKVNEGDGEVGQYSSSISAYGNGNFVIVWQDDRDGDVNIYAQLYSITGNFLGTNFQVNDYYAGGFQGLPSVSVNNSGNFVVAWQDSRNGDHDIFAQRFASDGSLLGTNFKVNDDQGGEDQRYPSICMDRDGNFVIIWVDARNGDSDIFAQRYSSDGNALGTNFKVNNDQGFVPSIHTAPSISSDDRGDFVITWRDARNGNYAIYAQRYSSDGNVLGPNFKVNNDYGISYSPSISANDSGNFVITWVDSRYLGWEIYAQCYSRNGDILGRNFKINADQRNTDQSSSSISVDSIGNFVITWQDHQNEGFSDIYAQRFLNDGTARGTNFKVNNDQGLSAQVFPSISIDANGNFVITWQDGRNGDFDIYAQRYSSDGKALGTNFKVNIDFDSVSFKSPSISVNNIGDFVIMWVDCRNNNNDIYAQRYSNGGSEIRTNLKVNDDVGDAWLGNPSISMDGNGNFIITWEYSGDGGSDIYAQRFSNDGAEIGSNFIVNDTPKSLGRNHPSSISIDDNGNFIIVWVDNRNGDNDIYAQCYSNDGSSIESNFMVTSTGDNSQSFPDVQLWNNRIYNTWTNFHVRNAGSDIWANVLDWKNATEIKNKEIFQVSPFVILSQNYPNPFNASTKISYFVPKSGFVHLKIYDIYGKEIQTLENKFQNAGTYFIQFDASELSSGIYFYRIYADKFMDTKKFILAK